jgi:hypothetical protein
VNEQRFQAFACGLEMTQRARRVPTLDAEPLYNPTSTLPAVLVLSR